MNNYQICKNCVMDTTDPLINFDNNGICHYCLNFEENIVPSWNFGISCEEKLHKLSKDISSNQNGDFNCIIGLSGGTDSSYVAYVAKEKMGLRPLLFHVDAGWNSDQAVGNIEKLVEGLGLDLYTEVINWESMRRMQVAFLKAGIPDQDLVQDAVFFSCLYKFAKKYKVKHIITGYNYSTEYCREPEEWGGYVGIDTTLFKDIWKKHGDGKPIDDFPLVDIFVYKIWYQRILGMKVHYPLNMLPYIKKNAEEELNSLFGWLPFQHKHHESRFTRFIEDFWYPKRFGFEKRRSHFTSLIMTKQMKRQDAIDRLKKPEMDELLTLREFDYVASKLELTTDELNKLIELPKKTFHSFKNKRNFINLGAIISRKLGLEKRFFR